jgi:P63C domain
MQIEDEVGGRAKGGKARNAEMSPEERKAQSMKMVAAKKAKAERTAGMSRVLLKKDPLELAGIVLACAIIEGPSGREHEVRRVLTGTGIAEAIIGGRSGASIKLRRKAREEGRVPLPIFLAPGQLSAFINNDLEFEPLLHPVEYLDGDRIVEGYDARILPLVCEIWLKAREAGALQSQQLDKAQKAELLMRALAHVGIIALVDEATGYQDIRPRDALAKILEAFVAKELRPWVRRFPPEFYKEIFRLRGLEFNASSVKRPQYFGHITNDIVLRRLAPGVWAELKAQVKKNENGKPLHKLHQKLTEEIGDPRLQKVITQVTTIMQLSKDWMDFKEKLDTLVPAFGETIPLPLNFGHDDGKGL